ncbi:MAG: hypothetical protein DLM59_03400 [Pseudonocardiales bacterium]|nr:MAG: hypothetical protein DLM59_03400 [Pseudonocardiales bacterium]
MSYPLVLELAADGIAVTLIRRVLGFSTQAFYKWKKQPVTRRDWDDAHLLNAALDIDDGAPEFGYRLVADELPEHGNTAGENRVQRLCSAQRIWSLHSKKRGLNRKAGPPVHDDLLAIPGGGRDFTARAPNVKWLTDITEHPASSPAAAAARHRRSKPWPSTWTSLRRRSPSPTPQGKKVPPTFTVEDGPGRERAGTSGSRGDAHARHRPGWGDRRRRTPG